jgi:hypothetical protein
VSELNGEFEVLPKCFTAYPKAISPHRCEECPFKEDCKKCIRRDALQPILLKLLEIKRILGEIHG